MLHEILNQIFETIFMCKDYLKNLNLSTLLLSLALVYIIFLRKWTLKKIISFLTVNVLFFVLLVRFEAFLLTALGPQDSSLGIGLGRTIFLVIASVILIYHAAVKE